jgi:hypothetical protein
MDGARVLFQSQAFTIWQARADWRDGRQQTWRAAHHAVTDARGRFAAELPPGLYRLEAVRPSFHQPRAVHVRVSSGEQVEGVRIELVPTSAMTGRVVDDTGSPVHSAVVRAVRAQYRDGRRIVAPCETGTLDGATQVTDEHGEYRLFGLAPGDYYVTATASVPAVADGCSVFAQYYPGVIDRADAITVAVRTGLNPAGIDIRISETGFHLARFDVVAPPGLPEPPVSRTAVHVVRRSRDGQHAGSILAVGRGGWLHQVGDGLFATRPLPPGVYDLYYRRYLSTSIGVLSFQIVDDDVDAGTMVLRPLVPVRGVVTGPAGIVSNYGDVMVVLKPLDGWSQALMLPGVMRPDTAGVFASPDDPGGIPEGRYRAAVLGLPPDVYVAAMRHGGLEIGDDGLHLSAATAGRRLDILLDGPGGIVEGTVHDRRAEAVPFSQVVLAPAPERRQNADLFRASESDETGRYVFRGVPPGEYALLAWRVVEEGAWQNDEFLRAFDNRALPVRVTRGGREVVVLRAIEPED